MKNVFNLSLHKKQKQVFLDPKRFKLLISGRRFGKSRLLLTSVLVAALSFNQPIDPASPPVCLIVMPTLKACRAIHWEPLLNLLEGQPFVESISRTDFRVKLKGGKPDILLRGADNQGDSLRGLKIAYVGVDEVQDFPLKAWQDVLYPALADTPNSKALLIGTPKGKTHWLYNFHLEAKLNKDWSYYHFVTKDNPFVPRSFLRKAELTLPPKSYRQEMEASFEDFDGQIFDQLSNKHFTTSILSEVTYYIGVDWGDTNPAIAVIGLTKDYSKFYIIDSWYNSTGQPVVQDEVLNKVANFCTKYNVRRCYLPDDRPASIKAARNLGKQRNIEGLLRTKQVNRNATKVMEGCEIINSLFYQDRLFIKDSLSEVKSQFQDYHRATNGSGNIVNKPAENQTDHLVDAARYALVNLHHAIEAKK
ncbi:hypothetical protein ACQFX9_14350 [Aliinostoc sp. HNIBRCY26]|uniref:phage terminase large subunit family protein n=1 Tax=Aliinostoc sp. HNIBRCY26 TaxID=3418997 RepID=UPI003D075D6B